MACQRCGRRVEPGASSCAQCGGRLGYTGATVRLPPAPRWRSAPHSVRMGVVIAGVLLALGYGVFTLVHTPSDAALLARFQSHRVRFDQLLQMVVADQRDLWIDSTDRSWSGPTLTRDWMPPARRQDYLRLMRPVGIIRLWGSPLRGITFNARFRGLIFGPEKSWVYSTGALTDPIPIPLTDHDTAAYHFPPGAYRKVCRPIETHWYICVDYED